MNEQKLIDKLPLIERLASGATTKGEEIAAELAKERILKQLRRFEKEDPPVEYQFTMTDMWSRKVFVALLRRYRIKPYRYHRQRHTTVMAKLSKTFVDETLWPEFQDISSTFSDHLSEVTDRVILQVLDQESSEAAVIEKQKRI